jgi:hypothetical protein
MNFETMIGTTGIASKGDILFIANNKFITRIDGTNKTDLPHPYERIEDIVVGGNFLAGIYANEGTYGVFILDLTTNSYNSIVLPNKLLKIRFKLNDNQYYLFVVDNTQTIYIYNDNLVEITIFNAKIPFNTIDITEAGDNIYLKIDNEIKMNDLTNDSMNVTIKGDLLGIQGYANYLFIFYMSGMNLYSVVQHDLSSNTNLKEIECGQYSSPIYTCVHKNDLYISSTVNKRIPLDSFSPTGTTIEGFASYPLLELNSAYSNFIELGIDLPKMKEKKESYAVDSKPVESSLFQYYVWIFIMILLIGLIVLGFMTSAGSVNIAILLILLTSAVFIIHSYI